MFVLLGLESKFGMSSFGARFDPGCAGSPTFGGENGLAAGGDPTLPKPGAVSPVGDIICGV